MAAGSTPKLAAYWDIDNCSTGDTFWVATRITHKLKKMMGDTPFTIKAYGKTNKLSPNQRKGLLRELVPLIDIPDEEANTTDRMIMEDMFLFALENKPPSFIMLLSGDGDFSNAFEYLTKLGYTCLLVYPENVTAWRLKFMSAYTYK
ncbi:chromo domain protein LHP1 [Tanacetum coccineum]